MQRLNETEETTASNICSNSQKILNLVIGLLLSFMESIAVF